MEKDSGYSLVELLLIIILSSLTVNAFYRSREYTLNLQARKLCKGIERNLISLQSLATTTGVDSRAFLKDGNQLIGSLDSKLVSRIDGKPFQIEITSGATSLRSTTFYSTGNSSPSNISVLKNRNELCRIKISLRGRIYEENL